MDLTLAKDTIKEIIFKPLGRNIKNIQSQEFENKKSPARKTAATSSNFNSYLPDSLLKKELATQRRKLLKTITSESEYNAAVAEVLSYMDTKELNKKIMSESEYNAAVAKAHSYTDTKESDSKKYIDTRYYESTEEELKGLIAYCGFNDKSSEINCWLTGRNPAYTKYFLDDKKMARIIDILNYSLKQLDEKYGVYNGIVYRGGYFNPLSDRQYYSTTFDPICAFDHYGWKKPSKKSTYSIIKLKKGHKIFDFQKSVPSRKAQIFATREKEILIDTDSRFRIIPPNKYSIGDYQLKTTFIKDFFGISQAEAEEMMANPEDSEIVDNIKIWEEI